MAENSTDTAAGEDEKTSDRYFGINKIYLQDASFESPNAAELFISEADWDPKIEVGVSVKSKKLSSDEHETTLKISLTAAHQDKVAYIVEVVQCGIFTMRGFEDSEHHGLRYSYCPNILYPYISQTVSDLVVKGGFPAYTIEPIDFEALYTNDQKQRQSEEA